MLIYNHAFDVYHCAFRILLLLYRGAKEFTLDQLRIFDFIIAFPEVLYKTKLPRGIRFKKQSINKYNSPVDPSKVFYSIENIQLSALKMLAAQGLIDNEKFATGIIVLKNKKALSSDLINHFNKIDPLMQKALKICLTALYSLPTKGKDGLKSRTNMMEYRYDV